MTAVLELKDVTKSYGMGENRIEVLHGVSLRITAGEAVSIVGASGSGKSTLLNIMGLLDLPTSGEIEIGGHDSTQLRDNAIAAIRARHLGFVFQQFFLLDGRTALDNVADGLLYGGIRLRKRRERAALALERVGLASRLTHRPSQLSGGECQRVAIARALVHDPAIILADEPTGSLDSTNSQEVLDLFLELHAQGTTLAMITHDPDVANRFPRVVTVKDGDILSDIARRATTARTSDDLLMVSGGAA